MKTLFDDWQRLMKDYPSNLRPLLDLNPQHEIDMYLAFHAGALSAIISITGTVDLSREEFVRHVEKLTVEARDGARDVTGVLKTACRTQN